jgi:hypothetical protein
MHAIPLACGDKAFHLFLQWVMTLNASLIMRRYAVALPFSLARRLGFVQCTKTMQPAIKQAPGAN